MPEPIAVRKLGGLVVGGTYRCVSENPDKAVLFEGDPFTVVSPPAVMRKPGGGPNLTRKVYVVTICHTASRSWADALAGEFDETILYLDGCLVSLYDLGIGLYDGLYLADPEVVTQRVASLVTSPA